MRRLAIFLLLAALGSLPAWSQSICGVGSAGRLQVLGPELHDNLWQFARYRSFWRAANALQTVSADALAMGYWEGYYYAGFSAKSDALWGGSCPADGEEIIGAVEYQSDANTVAQRGFYAVGSLYANNYVAEGTATMHEIPQPGAVVNAGTVTLSWIAVPEQATGLITGYQIVRSADGIASWIAVGTVSPGTTTTDAPGPGTWYYALKLRFKGDGYDRLTPWHGLAAMVTIP